MNNFIYGKFLFLGCDEVISRTLNLFMRYCSHSPSTLIDKIRIVSDQKIDNCISYRCLSEDVDRYIARFEAWRYSTTYHHLNISFGLNFPESVTPQYIASSFDEEISRSVNFKKNYFIITCHSTPKNLLNDIREILADKTLIDNFTHIHCDIGNPEDGGFVFYSNSEEIKKQQDYHPKQMPIIRTGDKHSIKMTAQALMGASSVFSVLINAIAFNTHRSIPVYFNYSKMDIDNSPYVPKLPKPINLLKQEDSSDTESVDDQFYILMVGLGAFGSYTYDVIAQIFNTHSNKLGKLVLMDGDTSEAKNYRNQNLRTSDIGTFKVNPLVSRYTKAYPKLESKIKAIPEYLYDLNEEFLLNAFELESLKDKNIIILGGVDKKASRKVMHFGFSNINTTKNLIYIDSGNGSDERIGQTIIGYKQNNNVILEPIASSGFDNGEILKSTEDISSIGSCAINILEKPQHLTTTFAAVSSAIANLVNIIDDGVIKNHISIFSAEDVSMNRY